MYEEVIAKYRIGSWHKSVYANLTGNQMWSIVQSKFGQASQQSAIAETRQACEDHATQSGLDPSKCVPVAVDDQQVLDPGPLFSAQDLQTNLSALPYGCYRSRNSVSEDAPNGGSPGIPMTAFLLKPNRRPISVSGVPSSHGRLRVQ
jgi:hypothetical protein